MRKKTLSILAVVLSTACGPQTEVPDGSENPDLTQLAYELKGTSLEQAMRDRHFRPLCDAQGFPLVGNVVSKVDMTDVSTFCSEVRRQHK